MGGGGRRWRRVGEDGGDDEAWGLALFGVL